MKENICKECKSIYEMKLETDLRNLIEGIHARINSIVKNQAEINNHFTERFLTAENAIDVQKVKTGGNKIDISNLKQETKIKFEDTRDVKNDYKNQQKSKVVQSGVALKSKVPTEAGYYFYDKHPVEIIWCQEKHKLVKIITGVSLKLNIKDDGKWGERIK